MSATLVHPFKPIFDKNSQILILGSFPSVASRQRGFYYSHAQNRFWRVLAGVFDAAIPQNVDEKIEFLLKRKIAIYDAAISCEIVGSSDSKMTRIIPANLEPIFAGSNIIQVFANGSKAHEICEKFLKERILQATSKNAVKLPSTSSANAKFSLEALILNWRKELEILLR